jgi:hypothetical protein
MGLGEITVNWTQWLINAVTGKVGPGTPLSIKQTNLEWKYLACDLGSLLHLVQNSSVRLVLPASLFRR